MERFLALIELKDAMEVQDLRRSDVLGRESKLPSKNIKVLKEHGRAYNATLECRARRGRPPNDTTYECTFCRKFCGPLGELRKHWKDTHFAKRASYARLPKTLEHHYCPVCVKAGKVKPLSAT